MGAASVFAGDMMASRARSWLFTPAIRPERFGKAEAAGADIAVLDLEDSIAPQDKAAARQAALTFLADRRKGGIAFAVRINAIDAAAGKSDLDALLASRAEPDFVVLPKTESADQIVLLDRLLNSAGKQSRIVAQIENARGLAAADAIAVSAQRLFGVMFGAADMAADLGCEVSWDALAYARGKIVAACALGSIAAIDTPFFDLRNESGLNSEAKRAAAFGFSGKAAVHPAQVAAINEMFSPTPEDIEKARAVLIENRKGVGTVGGMMIDEAMARKARRILAAAGLLD
jgi:(S)-citramalyl-CoA lyase